MKPFSASQEGEGNILEHEVCIKEIGGLIDTAVFFPVGIQNYATQPG